MKKKDFIERYGGTAYEKLETQIRNWSKANPEKLECYRRDQNRKGGHRYEVKRKYNMTGIAWKRNKVRNKHRYKYHRYKKIIAPNSQLHHQWQLGSAGYDGVALVETDRHMHGFVDVIRILEGEITLFTEQAIRER